jgi:hypothetical protein
MKATDLLHNPGQSLWLDNIRRNPWVLQRSISR